MNHHRCPRLLLGTLAATLAAGCTVHPAPQPKQWAPIPAYATGLDASAGTTCGHGVDSIPDAAIVVDVLIDSLEGSAFNMMPVIVHPLPDWQKSRPRPVIGVTLVYPRPGATTMRESWSECGAQEGATIRVNAATIGKAGLVIASAEPVRVTIRAMDGRPLTKPMLLSSTGSRVLLRWASASRAT